MKSWEWFTNHTSPETLEQLKSVDSYGYDLKIMGVTGTVGKTTVAELTTQYLNFLGKRTFYIGTSGINCAVANYWHYNFPSTSPTSQQMLATFIHGAYFYGCEYLVIEVTAETISTGIYENLDFDCLAYTNLKRNIVRSFKDDNIYFGYKLSILKTNNIGYILSSNRNKDFINITAKIGIKPTLFDFNFKIDESGKLIAQLDGNTFNTNLLSSINAENVALFYYIIKYMGVLDTTALSQYLSQITIPGRLEHFEIAGRKFMIDTGYGGVDGLRPYFEETKFDRVISVMSSYFFNNDNDTCDNLIKKRKERAELVAKYSDIMYITATHRRTGNLVEDREQCVIDQLQLGAPNAIQIYNRVQAIETACLASKPGDTIIIIGMGSETWGLIEGSNNYIGDFEIIKMVMENLYN